jgi:hypothetical protein
MPRVRWLARLNRIAHAMTGPVGRCRTLCLLPEIDARDAWPESSRCGVCLRLAAELEAASR